MTAPVRVVLIEDHPLTADGVQALFKGAEGIDVVATARSGAAGLDRVAEVGADVAIVDLSLPDMSGLDVLSQLGKRHPEVGCVVLTMHEEEEYIPRAARAGARGYVLKSDDPARLIEVVHTVHAGGHHFPEVAAAAILRGLAPARPKLTAREQQVLVRLAQGRINKEIADELHIGVRTVETYRARLMRKLDLHSVADLTRFAIAEGLLSA